MSDYQRGYKTGRSTGERKADAALAEAWTQADEAIARAQRAEAAQGFGRCDGCARWTVGGDGCRWGACAGPNVSRFHGNEALWFRGELPGSAVTTSASFGCVLFVARKS